MGAKGKIVVGVAAAACCACGVLMWALCDLCARLDEMDAHLYDYAHRRRCE